MKKVILFIFFVINFSLITSCTKLITKNITLTCSYQMYACGNCVPQFWVQKIESNNQILKENILNRNIYVVHEKSKKSISEGIVKCLICYTFVVKGKLEKKGDDYILLAKNVKKNFHSDCCNK